MKHAVVGIFAHVDAGKTTLAEALLYEAGALRTKGRVDHGDAFLDFDQAERARGITIFSSQGVLEHNGVRYTLLDTPGHVDFSTEAERVLHVLDYAVLVVDANAGVQGHTETLWHLLAEYAVPTVVFFNKMDLAHESAAEVLRAAQSQLGPGLFDASLAADTATQEELALASESALEEFLETGALSGKTMAHLFRQRAAFPCFFGSALKSEGVSTFLEGLSAWCVPPVWPEEFSARTFKVTHDDKGNRLLWLKVTGGTLRAKQVVSAGDVRIQGVATPGAAPESNWTSKVEQLRVYSGAKFESVSEAASGQVCAVMGLPHVLPGSALGATAPAPLPRLVPVLAYRVNYGTQDVHAVVAALRTLTDEDPCLSSVWDTELQELRVNIMGEIQLEVLQGMLKTRFDLDVSFECGSVLYLETITEPVHGVGHFEPLKHYAEAHYQLEPLPRGTGVEFGSRCSLDALDLNWQRLTLTNAMERPHKGVLMGGRLTDVRLTLLGGRAHLKHTEGGDFRQATYRAIRQGLMVAREQGKCQLLEPWYQFTLRVPEEKLGRALADLQRLCARFDAPESAGNFARITGNVPVSEVGSYPLEVAAYTGGRGSLTCVFAGYEPCHNTSAVLAAHPYDPEADLPHTPDSVFCAHGAGYTVKWPDVPAAAHVEIDPRALGPYRSAAEVLGMRQTNLS